MHDEICGGDFMKSMGTILRLFVTEVLL